jgi:hypothetical protein
LGLQIQSSLAVLNAPVVQTASQFHYQIGKVFFRATQNVFDNSTALYSSNGVFDAHANPRDSLVASFLRGLQFLLARLFFG